jgi:Rieske Fe-S protein
MEETPADVGRRSVLNWFLGTTFGALFVSVFYPILKFLSPPDVPEAATSQIEAGSTHDPELLDKGFKIVRFGAEPVIVIRVSESDFRAYTATCTHLDCIVEFRKDVGKIWCNCHDGQYDLEGRNVAGPPPRPLTPYQVHVVDKGSGQPGTLVVAKG